MYHRRTTPPPPTTPPTDDTASMETLLAAASTASDIVVVAGRATADDAFVPLLSAYDGSGGNCHDAVDAGGDVPQSQQHLLNDTDDSDDSDNVIVRFLRRLGLGDSDDSGDDSNGDA